MPRLPAIARLSARDRVFSLILLATTALRVAVLLRSKCWLDGDESVVGMMAIHVLRNGEIPVYFWGQPYAGGGAIEAVLAAAVFKLAGISAVAVKAFPLIFSLASLLLVYLLCSRAWGGSAGLWAAGLSAVGSPLFEWSYKARGGYAEIPFFTALSLYLLFSIDEDEQHAGGRLFVLGLTAGFSYYSLELIAPLFLAMALYTAVTRPGFINTKAILTLACGAALGLAPALVYNLAHDFANLRYISGAARHSSIRWAAVAPRLVEHLPAFFRAGNVDGYPKRTGARACAEALVYLAAASFAIVSWARGRKPAAKGKLDLAALCGLQLLIQLPLVVLNDRSNSSPRYFLPVFMPVLLLAALGLSRLTCSTPRARLGLPYAAGWLAGLWLLASGVLTSVDALQGSWVDDDVLMGDGTIHNVLVPGDSVRKIVVLLDHNGIDRVRTTYFVQWRLLFESQERIVSSSKGLHPGGSRHPEYDRLVARARAPALVLHKDSVENARLANRVKYRKLAVDDYRVYLPRAGRSAAARQPAHSRRRPARSSSNKSGVSGT